MAATRSPVVRLRHIQDEIKCLTSACAGVDYQSFASSYVLVRTTEHAILIIAEAVKALPPELTDRYPEIDWRAIRSMGNILRHEYERVETRILWKVLTENLPKLAPVIDRMIADTAD